MLYNIRVAVVVFGIWVPVLFSNQVVGEYQGGWIQNGTSCYYFSNTLKDWVSASASCRAHAAELVVIETQEENNFIEAQGKRIKGYFWLDGTDEINEGQWEWASMAEPFEYSNWNSGEPNDSGHNEDCLMTWDRYTNGGWNDVPCDRHYKYICERNIEDFVIGK